MLINSSFKMKPSVVFLRYRGKAMLNPIEVEIVRLQVMSGKLVACVAVPAGRRHR